MILKHITKTIQKLTQSPCGTVKCQLLLVLHRNKINMSHTILLVQTGKNPNTRTYADYNTVDECTDGICKLFEEHLKKLHPHSPSITYDISELYDFIDSLTDLSCLIFQGEPTNTYLPFNKDWIKERIYIQLRKQAAAK